MTFPQSPTTVTILPENEWVLDVKDEKERTFVANAAMYAGQHIFRRNEEIVQGTSLSLAQKRAFSEQTSALVALRNEHRDALKQSACEQRDGFAKVADLLKVAIPASIQAQHNSSVKGKQGERCLDEKIVQQFGGRSVLTDCSGKAHAGDRLLGSVLIEYKDYANTVPAKEIDKFSRDMLESSALIGILCSFTSHFAKFPSDRASFLKVGDKVIVLLPNAGHDGEKLLLALEWAHWVIDTTKKEDPQQCNVQRLVSMSQDILSDIDTLARDLSQISDHMKKELARLDNSRMQTIASMRARLDMISYLSRG